MYTHDHLDHLSIALSVALAAVAILAWDAGLVAAGGLGLVLAAHIYWLSDRVAYDEWLIAPTKETTMTIGTCSAGLIAILAVLALLWRI